MIVLIDYSFFHTTQSFIITIIMQHLEHEEEDPIVSEEAKRQRKIHKFKEYLVSSGCVMHFVKFMLGVRNKQRADDSVPSQDVLKMFHDYIGAVQVDTSEHDQMVKQAEEVRAENESLKAEIEQVKKEIEEKKIEKEKEEEERRLREEEEAAKNAKKGAKK